MKVSNKDSVDLQSLHRSQKSKKADAVTEKKNSEVSDIGVSTNAGASVELSDDAKLLSRATDAAKTADVSDKEKIEMIKAKIREGKYNPDYGQVADKMLNEHIINN